MQQFKIVGLLSPVLFDDYVSSYLVDIVYIDLVGDDYVTFIADNSFDINNPDDAAWMISLIKNALYECREYNAAILL